MKKQNEVKCKNQMCENGYIVYPATAGRGITRSPCPDCTDPQPTDEDGFKAFCKEYNMDYRFDRIDGGSISSPYSNYETVKASIIYKLYSKKCVELDSYKETKESDLRARVELRRADQTTIKLQSAKLKEQAEEIERCHKVMQKQATTNESLSSLLSEAVEYIKNVEKITNNKCGCLDKDETFATWCYAVRAFLFSLFTAGCKAQESKHQAELTGLRDKLACCGNCCHLDDCTWSEDPRTNFPFGLCNSWEMKE